MKEFKVNNYITLKLEDGKTNIYLNKEIFEQCKFLPLSIPVKKIASFDAIQSVDEAMERLNRKLEGVEVEDFNIPPEVEFWAHCSNLQAWNENNYNTCLLHSNLAFPLLKKLTKSGDIVANRVFKEEIAKRLGSGYLPVIRYLIEEEYTKYLSSEEYYYALFNYNIQAESEARFLIELESQAGLHLDGWHLEPVKKLEEECGRDLLIKNETVVGISLGGSGIKYIPDSIGKLKSLKEIHFFDNKIKNIPASIGNLENLEVLNLFANEISNLPDTMKKLKKLKILNLSHNNLKEIPEFVGGLKNLRSLALKDNKLKKIPESIGNLEFLNELDLRRNSIEFLPKSLGKLQQKVLL